jgi:hypothetical protein
MAKGKSSPLTALSLAFLVAMSFVIDLKASPHSPRMNSSGRSSATQEPRIAIVYKPINDIAMASFEGGREVIYINKERWDKLSEPARRFIYEHEYAHHALRHVTDIASAGGFVNSVFRKEQEAAADCYATRTFVALQALEQLKDVLALTRNLAASPDHPLPEYRVDYIQECVSKALEKPGGGGDPEALEYLILEKRKIEWQEDGEPPTVSYVLTFRNGGNIPLHCIATIACGHLPRSNAAGDKSNWLPFDANTYKFTLKPGERYVARGYLTWYRLYGDKATMPSLIIPGGTKDIERNYVSCTFASGFPRPPKKTAIDLASSLPKLIDASIDNFNGFLGAIEEEKKKHKSLTLISGAKECWVEVSGDSQSTYDCDMPETTDSQVLEKQYQELVRLIKQSLPADWESKEGLDKSQKKEFEAWEKGKEFDGPRLRVWITVYDPVSRGRQREYKLHITFYSPE